MSLFRRCKHTWQVKAVQTFDMKTWLGGSWHDTTPQTTIHYLCNECQTNRTREIDGTFNLATAKEVFPKP